MKNFLFFFTILLCFLNCDSNKEFQGNWNNSFLKYSSYNQTRSVVIKKDSIIFNYPYFDFWNKFSLKIEKRKLQFKDITLKAKIESDTLTLNDSIALIRNYKDTLNWFEPLLKIELPQILNIKPHIKYNDDYTIFLFYGERIDNKEYGLQLNDKIAIYSDLPSFLSVGCGGRKEELIPFVTNYLFIDKNSQMKEIENIFIEMSKVNSLNVKFVNDINLKFNDSLGLYYDYQYIQKRIYPFLAHSSYNTTPDQISRPPLPPPPFSLFDNNNLDSKFIYLKKDKLYFENKIIRSTELKKLMKPWVEDKKIIFSLYDLESSYGSLLELNSEINSVYEEIREEHSKIKFNKPLKDLSREEIIQIKEQIPMIHIWDYSIEHFNHVVEKDNSFYGLKINPIN